MENRTENREDELKKDEKLYTVGDVCEQMGITRKTLFYYDQIGLRCHSKAGYMQRNA